MKNKKLTLASVILAVVLVSGLTIGVLAASANTNEIIEPNADSRNDVNASLFSLDGKEMKANEINDNAFYSMPNNEARVANEIREEQDSLPLQDERTDANVNTNNDVIMSFELISVSRSDEKKFTADEWKNILAKIEKGEIYWED